MTELIGLPEAARRASVSATSVRRWMENGKLKAKKNSDGEWRICFEDLKNFLVTVQPNRRATVSPTINKQTLMVASNSDNLDGYRIALKEAQTALERERRNNDIFQQQIQNLTSEIFKMTHEMQAILTQSSPVDSISRWIRSKTI